MQFAESENNIISSLIYILIKLLHDVDVNVFIFKLSSSVMTIESVEFRHNERDDKYVKFFQFSFTLIYIIIDYKCQELTFELIIIDLKRLIIEFSIVYFSYI